MVPAYGLFSGLQPFRVDIKFAVEALVISYGLQKYVGSFHKTKRHNNDFTVPTLYKSAFFKIGSNNVDPIALIC